MVKVEASGYQQDTKVTERRIRAMTREQAGVMLKGAREALKPHRNTFIYVTYWLMSGFLKENQLVVPLMYMWLYASNEEVKITEEKISPGKKLTGGGRTNYLVERSVKKEGGDYAVKNLPHVIIGEDGIPFEISSKDLMRGLFVARNRFLKSPCKPFL